MQIVIPLFGKVPFQLVEFEILTHQQVNCIILGCCYARFMVHVALLIFEWLTILNFLTLKMLVMHYDFFMIALNGNWHLDKSLLGQRHGNYSISSLLFCCMLMFWNLLGYGCPFGMI